MSTNEGETPLDPDEPQTPAWFTFLGIGLFLVGGIFLLATADDEEESSSEAPAEAAAENAGEEEAAEPSEPAKEAAPDPHAGHGHD